METKDKKLLSLLAQQNNSEALRTAGYSASDLRTAGYSASALRTAGYSASDLITAGYSASALRTAGYSASDLRTAGYSASDLITAGYSLLDLRTAGYSLLDLRTAGYSASDLRTAGYSASDLITAGYSLLDLITAGYSASDLRINGVEFIEWDTLIPIEKPYSKIWNDIQTKKRLFKQSTFGPSEKPVDEKHLCDTPMCTAGNLVNLAGAQGWELQKKYGFSVAASLIHQKSCPDFPEQNYQSIPDEWALAYIEEMAERESKR